MKKIEPAPAEVIRLDYDLLKDNFHLRTSPEAEEIIFPQSIMGHSHEGHAAFLEGGLRYVNTTMDNITTALGLKPKEAKAKRQKIVNDIMSFIYKAAEGKLEYMINEDQQPLLGIEMFTDLKIQDNKTFLIGAYLASVMDNYRWRRRVSKKYGFEMGGGVCCAVNIENMKKSGEDFDTLAQIEHDMYAFEDLRMKGILPKSRQKRIKTTKIWQNGYVRIKKGKGVSDDAAIIIAGKLYPGKDPCSAALGVYVVDLIDTLDKYLPYIEEGGVDETVGPKIKERGQISLTDDEILKAIYLFAIPPGKKVPDCSQRYFLEIDSETDQTALESHIKYLQGKQYKEMKIGSRKGVRKSNTAFYEYVAERIYTCPN